MNQNINVTLFAIPDIHWRIPYSSKTGSATLCDPRALGDEKVKDILNGQSGGKSGNEQLEGSGSSNNLAKWVGWYSTGYRRGVAAAETCCPGCRYQSIDVAGVAAGIWEVVLGLATNAAETLGPLGLCSVVQSLTEGGSCDISS